MRNIETPAARATDPSTSHAAAAHVTNNGVRRCQQQLVADALKRFPRSTSRELAHYAGLDRYMVARRLSELRTGESAACTPESEPKRRCTLGNLPAVEWWPV